jgi:hypothetical protein
MKAWKMNVTKIWKTCLGIAGGNSLLMAGYHFYLPYQFDWDEKLASVAPIFPWALNVLNFSWSLMLLLVSFLVLSIAKRGPGKSFHESSIIVGLGIYWFVHGVYLIAVQPPLPPNLVWIKWILLAYPMTISFLHFFPMWVARKSAAA